LRKRLLLLAPLLAVFAFVATTEERAEAADVATPVEGESFVRANANHTVVSDPMYSGGQALKIADTTGVSYADNVNLNQSANITIRARGGSSGGWPSLQLVVDGSNVGSPVEINSAASPATFNIGANISSGSHDIGFKGVNVATGRNAFVDVMSFPASGSGGTDPGVDSDGDGKPDSLDNCPDDYNPGQRDDDNDGVGNKCDDGSTTPPPSSDWPASDCEVEIRPGQDIDAIINNDASGTATTFCVYAGSYTVSAPAILKAGDKLKGEPNPPLTPVGPANKPTPVVKLDASGSENLLRASGNDISITWVDLSGADGTGNGTGAIAAGSAGSDFLVQFARIHGNDSLGISSMNGTVLDSEFFSNSEANASLGFNGSAVKGITEYVAGRVYVHGEQGNGLWCDVGCKNSARTDSNMTQECPTGCFWVYDSVVEDGRRAGIRYENSSSEALFENNVVRGNGITEHRGGIDIRDSQDAQVLNNILSANNGIGVRATDSGRSDRVNLERILVKENDLGGDRIVTCGGQVECINNTNVGTR
jgi:Right handed beta helix region